MERVGRATGFMIRMQMMQRRRIVIGIVVAHIVTSEIDGIVWRYREMLYVVLPLRCLLLMLINDDIDW